MRSVTVFATVFASCFAACLTIALPALAAAPKMTNWDAKENGSPRTYHLGGYALSLSARPDGDDMAAPHLSVRAPGLPVAALDGEAAGPVARAGFAVLPLARGEKPSVIFTTFSGGAHCCTKITVLQSVKGAWNTIDLGSWDGGGLGGVPKDADGDGVTDFVLVDNAFLYAFDSYAGSWAPPLILNVVDGHVKNVSAAPRYAALYRADMEKTKAACAEHSNGACAGYAADAARIGHFDEAWKFVLAHYDRESDWDYPTRCVGKRANGECKGREIKPRDFPQALQWFLQDNGYRPAAG
jgi:hypothetical protein